MVNIIYAIVFALIGLGILIVIHELGHFLVAKKTGVGVLTFSVGFGPKIFVLDRNALTVRVIWWKIWWKTLSFRKRRKTVSIPVPLPTLITLSFPIGPKLCKTVGETEYCLSAFPLGGYVKMVGEDPEEEVKEVDVQRSFSHHGLAKRVAIVAAGPVFNLLLAVIIFMWLFMSYGVPILTTRVGGVEPNSPASRAGMQKGDRIVELDGQAIKKWEELSSRIKDSQGRALNFRVQRDDREIKITVQPIKREGRNIFGEKTEIWAIGIASEVSIEKSNPGLAVGQAFYKTGEYSVLTLVALFKMIKGEVSPKNLGGPILIAQMAGQQAREGLAAFLFFVAILSVNLGVLNFLPIPMLDGGHLLFFLLEWALGRPVEIKHRERAQQVGIFILILVMIYAFYNDIARFFEG